MLDLYYEKLCQRPSIRETWPHHWLHTPVKHELLSKIDRFAKHYQTRDEAVCQHAETLTNEEEDQNERPALINIDD